MGIMAKTEVVLCLLTYARTQYAMKTLASTLNNLKTTKQIHVHIADDGSSPAHREMLLALAHKHHRVSGVSITNSERGGYGRNFNLASQVTHEIGNYVLVVEDDWELTGELDLDELVEHMASSDLVGCVRLGYLSWTQSLRGQVLKLGYLSYLLLDSDSPEPHVFTGHPRLEKVTYQRRVGGWPEGLAPGDTEFAVAHIKAARQGVAWPMDLVKSWGSMFAHIGTERSY